MQEKLLAWLSGADRLEAKRADEFRSAAAKQGVPLDRILLEKKVLTEPELLRFYAEAFSIPFLETLQGASVPPEFVKRVPAQFARNNHVVSIGRADGAFRVATARPQNLYALDDLAHMLGARVSAAAAPVAEIADLITRGYRNEGEEVVEETLKGVEEADFGEISKEIELSEDLLDIANKAPVIKLVNMLIFQAIKMRASDIHIQPYQDRLQVRYRVDGMLYDVMSPPKKLQEAIISRVKVMAKMDIAERRLPQDGGFAQKAANRDIDFRVSSIPTMFGERVVLRIQDKSKGIYDLEKIGLSPENLARMRELIEFSHGIILVTGPTGSGKTTTLYAALSRINTKDMNIITIENPIEYHLPGISQIEVSTKKGMTFATGLRSIVRQDPDVIMVGEIRDFETAEVAIQSALTGHLVFSTIHTNDAPGAITRLVDLGVEPFLVSSSVIAVVAQRLVRLICEKCKEPYADDPRKLVELGFLPEMARSITLWRGKGCEECLMSGYRERTAIYEILPIDDAIRDQIMRRESASRIKKDAVARGALKTLRMDGTAKVIAGLTTVEEVMRITQRDSF